MGWPSPNTGSLGKFRPMCLKWLALQSFHWDWEWQWCFLWGWCVFVIRIGARNDKFLFTLYVHIWYIYVYSTILILHTWYWDIYLYTILLILTYKRETWCFFWYKKQPLPQNSASKPWQQERVNLRQGRVGGGHGSRGPPWELTARNGPWKWVLVFFWEHKYSFPNHPFSRAIP